MINWIYRKYENRQNFSRLWGFDSDLTEINRGSSVSDKSSYLAIVNLACSSEDVFNSFRRNIHYREILDHVSFSQGKIYLDLLRNSRKDVRKLLAKVKNIDKVGGPIRHFYAPYGFYSPTTFRYLWVYHCLIKTFGSLDDLRVAEIGGGFSGQAAIIAKLESIKEYALYDLPEVLNLQKRVISKLRITGNFTFENGLNPTKKKYDLVLSNYAISEIAPKLQEKFFSTIINSAEAGYFIWNLLSEQNFGGMSISDVLARIPNSQLLVEQPLTAQGNKVIYWNHHAARL
jgi:hypothetical protein